MATLGLELRSTDAFLADTIALDPGRATTAIHRMRRRFRRPEITPSRLLQDMEASGLPETANLLRPQTESL